MSDLSATVSAIPELLVPAPDLPNEGCFIATAAFGHYSASQVQWLREFRDLHLKRFVLGRFFIKSYYAISPAVADVVRQSVLLKEVVRLSLLPLVVFSKLFVFWPFSFIVFLLLAGSSFVVLKRRKRRRILEVVL